MMREMSHAIVDANADDTIDAIVLTGAGRGFCAGADVQEVFKAKVDDLAGHDSGTPNHLADGDPGGWVDLVRSSKPLVAAINGAAIGVGLSQVLAFDMLIAANDAKLSLRFVKMGVLPELASSKFVTLRCGFGAASELTLTGKTVTGAEAVAMRLVDRSTDPGDLMPTALACARAMGENPQWAVRKTKELLTQNAHEADLTVVQNRELAALEDAYRSPEHREAINAFLEKRDPNFKAARRGTA